MKGEHFGPRAHILHWCITGAMSEALGKMDLTASQGRVMGFIARQETPPCSKDIEKAFGLSHPTVSGIISRLESKEFVEQRSDPADRRRKRLYILPKAHECFATMDAAIADIEKQIVKDFSAEEKTQFMALLDRAIENMGGGCHTCPDKEESQP